MRFSPRKWKFRLVQRGISSLNWNNFNSFKWGGTLYMRQRTKLFWYHFEMIRLRLAWDLGRRRQLSRKARYREKLMVKKKAMASFRRAKRNRATRLFWYAGFPHTVYSAKARGARMGGGKADPRSWCYLAYEGTPILRVCVTRPTRLRYVLARIQERLPGRPIIYYWVPNFYTVGGHPGLNLWY